MIIDVIVLELRVVDDELCVPRCVLFIEERLGFFCRNQRPLKMNA